MKCYKILLLVDEIKRIKEDRLVISVRKIDYSDKSIVLLVTTDWKKYKVESMDISRIGISQEIEIPEDMVEKVEKILLMWNKPQEE